MHSVMEAHKIFHTMTMSPMQPDENGISREQAKDTSRGLRIRKTIGHALWWQHRAIPHTMELRPKQPEERGDLYVCLLMR